MQMVHMICNKDGKADEKNSPEYPKNRVGKVGVRCYNLHDCECGETSVRALQERIVKLQSMD